MALEGISPTEQKRLSKIEQENDIKGQFHLVVYDWLKTLELAPITLDNRKSNVLKIL